MPTEQKGERVQTYAVVGKYLRQIIPIIAINPPMVLKIVEARSPEEAFKRFVALEAANLKDAQRFHDVIKVYPVADKAHQYKLSDKFGKKERFPEPDLFKF